MGLRESGRKATKVRRREVKTKKTNTKEHQQATTSRKSNEDNRLHDLILGQALRGLGALHHLRAGTRMHILDKSNPQRTASVLVPSELGCRGETVSTRREEKKRRDTIAPREQQTHQSQSQPAQRCRTQLHQYHGSGHWARTGSQLDQPYQ